MPAVPKASNARRCCSSSASASSVLSSARAHLPAHPPPRRPGRRRRLCLARRPLCHPSSARDARLLPRPRARDRRRRCSSACRPRWTSRGGASRPLVGDLTPAELVASEEAYLGSRVRALMIRLEQPRRLHAEHTRRVALPRHGCTGSRPARRRTSSSRPAARHRQAPRPGRDPAEGRAADRRGVRGHQAPPGRRRTLRHARRLPSAVRGSSGPSRAPGRPRLPERPERRRATFDARILAVCDVYDALVSTASIATPGRRSVHSQLHDETGRVRPGRGRRAGGGGRSGARRRRRRRTRRRRAPAAPPSQPSDERRGRLTKPSDAGDLARRPSSGHAHVGRDRHHREVAAAAVVAGGWRPTAAAEMLMPCSPRQEPTRPTMPGHVAVAEQRQVRVVDLEVEALAPGLEQVRAVLVAERRADDAARARRPRSRVTRIRSA